MGLENGVERVVIVGAGPAGIACAWRLAQLGLEPLLLEKETFPRDKVCGDALSGKVLSLLRKLGGEPLLADLLQQPFVYPVEHLDFISGKGKRVRLSFPPRNGYPQGCVAPRYAFDTWFLSHLPEGVRLRSSFELRKVERQGQIWHLTSTTGELVRAYFIVGADGVSSRIAPIVWDYHRLSRPVVYPAVRGYTEGKPPESLELHFKKPYLPGYLWRFPAGEYRLNVGVGLPTSALKKARLSLRAHLREIFPQLHSVQGHGIPISLENRPLTAPGCALIGDAAGLADPLTGEGIGNALLSGIRLAEALAKVPFADWPLADWEALYTTPLYSELRRELRITRFFHRMAQKEARVEAILGFLSRFSYATKPLLRWYGVKK